eukprot:c20723_g2_i1 orf=832-2181(+)
MQFDMRQAVAGALTIGMVIMLLNMIGNGPLSPTSEDMIVSSEGQSDASMPMGDERLQEPMLRIRKHTVRHESLKLWGLPGPVLQPCWGKHIASVTKRTWGHILIKLSNGPHYHSSQVADAVVVSRYLGATLLLPIIKGAAKEPNSNFDKIYDVNTFIMSLEGVIRVVGRLPDDARSVTPTLVKVPYGVTPEYIEDNIRPIFRKKGVIQLAPFFPNMSVKTEKDSNHEMEEIRCLVMYKALRFSSQVRKLGEHLLSRVREAAESAGGHFVAVDLRVDLLEQKGCMKFEGSKKKKCFNAYDVGTFLARLGFSSDTAIYITQSRWNHSLDPLKDKFPNIYTKEYSMPFNEEKQIFYSGNTQFEKAIDFYICTHSDVFIPAISGMFYLSVAGERIATGKTQILVPTVKEDLSYHVQLSDAVSRYVTRKKHPVYSCFCQTSSENVTLNGETDAE